MKRVVESTIALLSVVFTQTVAAVLLAGVLALCSASTWRWFHWLVAAPFLYLAWLFAVLAISAWLCASLGRRHPKPRYVRYKPGAKLDKKNLGLVTALVCYRRRVLVKSLPFVDLLERSRFRSLVYRSWSPSVHIGKDSVIGGDLFDPDLTVIGQNSFLGAPCHIVAHNIALQPDGTAVFLSAPIKIGDRVTTGGNVVISPGCVIEDDAVLEPGTVLLPSTHVPSGEVWGGNPATLRRKRPEVQSMPVSAPTALAIGVGELVQQALGMALEPAAWDSLSRIAIATAIFDRHGLTIPLENVMQWKTLDDVEKSIKEPGGVDSDPVDDLEMVPLLEPEKATQVLSHWKGETPPVRSLRLTIVSTFTVQALVPTLKLWGRCFGMDIECDVAPYGQVVQTLMTMQGETTVVLVRPEDLGPEPERYMDDLISAAESGNRTLLIGSLPPVVSAFAGLDRSSIDSVRQKWLSRFSTISNVRLLDFSGVIERLGVDRARASESEVVARSPYSPQVFQRLAIEITRHLLASRRSGAKVVAVDCDDTLWGGTVGEVGYGGIDLGPDGKGRSFQLFQEFLLRLKRRGILLAVVSRNEEHDVRYVFENHPEMILRSADIAGWKVNWGHKSDNLLELARDLQVGLDSIVFLDNDPAVRMAVKSALKAVHVVPLPEEPALWCETLERLWLFDAGPVTVEDGARTRMIQQEDERRQARDASLGLEFYLKDLGLEVAVDEPGELDWARVSQLSHRTNQFNSSLKRRSTEDMRSAAKSGHVLVLRARDRFGDYGLVGVAVLNPGDPSAELDSLLLSCRVLGRGVEETFLHAIGAKARECGARDLEVPIVIGPRNKVIRDFLAGQGFLEKEPNVLKIELSSIPSAPPHVRLIISETGAARKTLHQGLVQI